MSTRTPAERAFIHGYCIVANTIAGVSIPTDPDHPDWDPILASHREHWDQSRLYHEAHITVEPPVGVDFDAFRYLFGRDEWRVSAFAEDDVDSIVGKWFLSARHVSCQRLTQMVSDQVCLLEADRFTVLRAKIEDTILDTKNGDTL